MGKNKDSKFTWTFLNAIYLIIVLMIGFSLIYILSSTIAWFDAQYRDRLIKENHHTIGRIVRSGDMKGGYSVIEYFVDSIHFEIKEGAPRYCYEGEFFRVFYDKEDPEDAIIDFSYPIFLVDQDVDFAQCKIISEYNPSIYDFKNVSFKYTIDGIDYINLQRLPDSVNIVIGKNYKVQYLIENPEISRLWWW